MALQNMTAQQSPLTGAIHVGTRRLMWREQFLRRPGINANKAVPAGDTYNTAQMQLALDKHSDWELLGTNMTSALCTFAAGGGITLTTAGAANDQAILLPHLDTDLSPFTAIKWNTLDEVGAEFDLKIGASVASATIWAGFKLTNTPVVATDNDQMFVRYDSATNSGQWQAIGSYGGTDLTINSPVAVAASTEYKIGIRVDADRYPMFFVNERLIGKLSHALTTDTDLIPYVGVMATATGAKALTVREIALSKLKND